MAFLCPKRDARIIGSKVEDFTMIKLVTWSTEKPIITYTWLAGLLRKVCVG